MTEGIIWALISGLMLGLYALPSKFTKGFKEEKIWGLFFMLTMFAVPLLATATLLKGTGQIYADPDVKKVLPIMIISAVLWGTGGTFCAGAKGCILGSEVYDIVSALAGNHLY